MMAKRIVWKPRLKNPLLPSPPTPTPSSVIHNRGCIHLHHFPAHPGTDDAPAGIEQPASSWDVMSDKILSELYNTDSAAVGSDNHHHDDDATSTNNDMGAGPAFIACDLESVSDSNWEDCETASEFDSDTDDIETTPISPPRSSGTPENTRSIFGRSSSIHTPDPDAHMRDMISVYRSMLTMDHLETAQKMLALKSLHSMTSSAQVLYTSPPSVGFGRARHS